MSLIIRIYSPQKNFRVTLKPSDKVSTLLTEISKQTQINAKGIKCYLEKSMKREFKMKSFSTLKAYNFKNGQQLYIKGQVKIKEEKQIISSGPILGTGKVAKKVDEMQYTKDLRIKNQTEEEKKIEETKKQNEKKSKYEGSKPVQLNGKSIKQKVLKWNPLEVKCTKDSAYLKKIGLTKDCKHGPGAKCFHCLWLHTVQDTAHVPFDHFLISTATQNNTKDNYQNFFVHPETIQYTINKDCKLHLPYPAAMCQKCSPPAFTPTSQPYRHVDYMSFYNKEEMKNFVTKCDFIKQRVGFLVGWYAEDKNYKNGVRCIVEGIYEPPQEGSVEGFVLLKDNFFKSVQKVVEGLEMEIVGWIYTSIDNKNRLSSSEIRQIAKLQQKFKVAHPYGYNVTKFTTVVIKPSKDKEENLQGVKKIYCYQVTDQCQALETAGVFARNQDKRDVMKINEGKNYPVCITAKKGNMTEIDPNFFIVSVGHGQPKDHKYRYIKRFLFPVENRPKQPQTKNYIKGYMQKFKNREDSDKFSDFHLLIYLAKLIDPDTAKHLAECVVQNKSVNKNILEMIKQYIK